MTRRTLFELADHESRALVDALGYRNAQDALADRRGRCVRDVPHRRTFETEVDGVRVFRKLRVGRPADALREWLALGRMPAIGVRVPRPVFVARDGARTAVGMLEVAGRPLSELLAADVPVARYLAECVAPLIRRLHRAGFVHRDLYWGHCFADDLDPAGGPPTLIDLERVFRPVRWRRRRWIVKDLAGLVATWPRAESGRTIALRFLRAYSGGRLPAGWKPLARAILQKARRIRSHVPRHGSPPEWA